MHLLADNKREARLFAEKAIKRAKVELKAGKDYWPLATLGEAHLLLGHPDEALRYYKEAVKLASGKTGKSSSFALP